MHSDLCLADTDHHEIGFFRRQPACLGYRLSPRLASVHATNDA